jgi:hypothetical protein
VDGDEKVMYKSNAYGKSHITESFDVDGQQYTVKSKIEINGGYIAYVEIYQGGENDKKVWQVTGDQWGVFERETYIEGE